MYWPAMTPTCPSDAPASRHWFLVRSRFSALRPVMATEAPWRAKSTAVAAPIPELAPGDRASVMIMIEIDLQSQIN